MSPRSGLHLVIDASVREFPPEQEEILWEHAHRRREEQVLQARAQTKFQNVAGAERVDPPQVEVGHREGDIGRDVVHRVHAMTQLVETAPLQTEAGAADVPDHDAQAVGERVVPNLRLLQGRTQALQTMLFMFGPDQAVHDEIVVIPQEVAQQETSDETGRSRQEDLPKGRGRHRIRQLSPAHGLLNEPPEGLEIPLALER